MIQLLWYQSLERGLLEIKVYLKVLRKLRFTTSFLICFFYFLTLVSPDSCVGKPVKIPGEELGGVPATF
jgi:hypothetical protein